MELIYDGEEVLQIVKAEYPTAVFKDASDDVHSERFEVEFPEGTIIEDFWKFAIRKGFAYSCFGFQMNLRMEPGFATKMLEYVKSLPKKEKST